MPWADPALVRSPAPDCTTRSGSVPVTASEKWALVTAFIAVADRVISSAADGAARWWPLRSGRRSDPLSTPTIETAAAIASSSEAPRVRTSMTVLRRADG